MFYKLPTVRAAESFLTNYDVTYTVGEDGMTQGKFAITLTNATSQYYASTYKIAVGFADIKNVTASDPDGAISPTVQKTAEGNTIDLKFNKKAVGQGAKLPFTITFDTPNVATKNGTIWEINIPGIDKQNDFSSFSVAVKVPDSFGTPSYIKPQHSDNSLVFTKDELGKSGISLAFGQKQYYSFSLVYHLRNQNVFPIPSEIALPPTTGYQDVYIDSIDPKPSNVLIDKDGNWLAQYRLLPSQKTDVVVKGKVVMQLTPREEELTPELRSEYLKDKAYWPVSSSKIKQISRDLHRPQDIYNYVVQHLTYDYSRITKDTTRLGALTVLNHPDTAVCLEFTDLFITLARAAGIPAREIDGYGFTSNTKERPLSLDQYTLLHAWPEYYDDAKKTWIMVDPTWANTTGGVDYFHVMDFDHIAFVRKGVDSKYPVYAGGYKYEEDKNKQDVTVTLTPSIDEPQQHVELYSNLAPMFLSGLPIQGTLLVKNIGKGLVTAHTAHISSPRLVPQTSDIQIPPIPPFGVREQRLDFFALPFLTNGVYPFTITLADKKIDRSVIVRPFIVNKVTISGGIILAVLITALLIFTIRTRRVPVSQRR